MSFFQRIIAFFMSIFALLSSWLGISPSDEKSIDLNRFELVWSDEFEGTQLDPSKWQIQKTTLMRRGGYWNTELAEVQDGYLTIFARYLENGVNPGDPAGWYSARLRTKDLYEQTYGYFEVRCMLPEGYGLWSAFWMQNLEATQQAYPDGANGSEIDIMESPYYGSEAPNRIQNAVHWGGYDEHHQFVENTSADLGVDLYNTFHTYGVEWNTDAYIFYFDGKEIAQFDKTQLVPSQAPEHLLLTVEFNGADGVPSEGWAAGTAEDNGRDFVARFTVDYVRAYQYK